jgi:hypothetical protein
MKEQISFERYVYLIFSSQSYSSQVSRSFSTSALLYYVLKTYFQAKKN